MADDPLARLTRIEDRLESGNYRSGTRLPSISKRDLDAWVALFVPDVSVGGTGRGRRLAAPLDRTTVADVLPVHPPNRRTSGRAARRHHGAGQVYCRAEHEVGERWVVIDVRYDDRYRKINGSGCSSTAAIGISILQISWSARMTSVLRLGSGGESVLPHCDSRGPRFGPATTQAR